MSLFPVEDVATICSSHHQTSVNREETELLGYSHHLPYSTYTLACTLKPLTNMEQLVVESSLQSGNSSVSSNSINSSTNVKEVRKLLFKRMLVGVNDGRFFVGGFHCLDKQGNIILQDAVEYRTTGSFSLSPMEQRSLGLILIPSSCRSSVHVDCSVEEQLSLLSLQR